MYMRSFKAGAARIVLGYLRLFAKLQLAKVSPTVVGVTGSAGKTSAVAAIRTILSSRYRVRATEGGNSESGIPLTILGLKMRSYSVLDWLRVIVLAPLKVFFDWHRYDIFVAEMGVDRPYEPKNMTYLLRIIRPKVGVFLNALPAHTEFFGRDTDKEASREKLVERIAAEKGKLIVSLPPDGHAILNADDKNVFRFKDETDAMVMTFGTAPDAAVKNFLVEPKHFALTDDYGYTLAAAAAVGSVFGIPVPESKELLAKHLRLPPGRMSVLRGVRGSEILDSTYNASPGPMRGALKLLRERGAGHRKIAVLGDMRELGGLAPEAHREIVEEACKVADAVIIVGPSMKQFAPENERILHRFTYAFEAGVFLRSFIKEHDIVLFKASQAVFLETAVELCLADPSDAAHLTRRGAFWDEERSPPHQEATA